LLILSIKLLCIVVGVFFMFVASLGVVRLPDFYSRVHAPTKAATLGLFFLLFAISLDLAEGVVATKALLALIFIAATAPVGAHILARAAYRNGVAPMAGTETDEYAHRSGSERPIPKGVSRNMRAIWICRSAEKRPPFQA